VGRGRKSEIKKDESKDYADMIARNSTEKKKSRNHKRKKGIKHIINCP
jgi:polyhydroxyalkanoate synthesis regulator phasin